MIPLLRSPTGGAMPGGGRSVSIDAGQVVVVPALAQLVVLRGGLRVAGRGPGLELGSGGVVEDARGEQSSTRNTRVRPREC